MAYVLGMLSAIPSVAAVEIKGKLNRGIIATDDGRKYLVWRDEKGKDISKTMQGVRVHLHVEILKENGKEYVKVLDYVKNRDRAGHELWRRMRCNACVVQSAEVNVKPHGDLAGAVPVSGRYYPFKDRIQAFHVEGDSLWLAMDNRVAGVDLAAKRITATYGRENGLPDSWIYRVFSDSRTVWISHRKGVAALDIEKGSIQDLPEIRACYAIVCQEGDNVWVVADSGTWRISSPKLISNAMAPLPTGARIRKAIEGGLWLPHWRRKTAHFMRHVVATGGDLYVESYGAIYAFEDEKWRCISDNGWELSRGAGRLWFVSPGRLVEYEVEKGESREHAFPEEVAKGRAVHVYVDDSAVWVALVPRETAEPKSETPGGLLRFDLADASWRVWKRIEDSLLDHISHITREGDTLWVAAMEGSYVQRAAHPGMTYVKRRPFRSSRISLHRLADGGGEWRSLLLSSDIVENRFICGQDGVGAPDDIIPERIEDLFIGKDRIFAYQHLYAKKFFSGYWSCINQVVAREDDGQWQPAQVHDPAQLNLQGEQPLVLNISNKGEMVLEAVGHDEVLDLLNHAGNAWVVTEGTVAFFDPESERWQRVVQGAYRWYWRATAAYDDGKALFIGSDRGLLGRLDYTTGNFAITGAFKERAVDALAADASGRVVAWARQETLGQMPGDLPPTSQLIDGEVAAWDGKSWKLLAGEKAPERVHAAKWFVKDIRRGKKAKNVKGGRDRSPGNILFGPPASGSGKAVARFYVKDIFWPVYLCESADGKSLWIGTFTGLFRIDLP